MFNHESPRRPLPYVSQKIAYAAAAVSIGLRNTRETDERGLPLLKNGIVTLGNIDICRDFGFAGDYVEAMYAMLQCDTANHTRSVPSARPHSATWGVTGPIM